MKSATRGTMLTEALSVGDASRKLPATSVRCATESERSGCSDQSGKVPPLDHGDVVDDDAARDEIGVLRFDLEVEDVGRVIPEPCHRLDGVVFTQRRVEDQIARATFPDGLPLGAGPEGVAVGGLDLPPVLERHFNA